jgi:hypothetical protein
MKTQKTPPQPPKRIVNLLTVEQVEYILDGVQKSAFTISLDEGDDVVATLSAAGREVFVVDFTKQTISRVQDGKRTQVFKPSPPKFFSTPIEYRHYCLLEDAIREQYTLGGQEALTTNLITRREVVVLIDAVRAMAFKIDPQPTDFDVLLVSFEGREVFRVHTKERKVYMTALSGTSELVYTFAEEPAEWFWAGTDRKLWKDLTDAIAFYNSAMHKVRMSDYRALFGNQMQKVIVGLAQAMDEAEADVRLLERVDKTAGGASLHPDVARLVQKDLDAGEEQANQESEP